MSVETELDGKTTDDFLKDLYYHSSAGYSTLDRLYRAAKEKDGKITRKVVKEWLEKQKAYTRHRRVRWQFPRRKILALRIDFLWTSDLIQIDSLKSVNAGYSYILTCLDAFSRKLWTRKQKTKSKPEMLKSLRSIIAQNGGRSPYRLWTDFGLEYTTLHELYQEHEIERYSTFNNDKKAVLCERVNRTLQDILYKIMLSQGSWRWIDFLQEAEDIYNGRVHSALHGMTPNEAHQMENESKLRALFLKDYKRHKKRFAEQKPKFQPGDFVRVRKERSVFTRGYEPGFQDDIHVIESVQKTHPYTFKIVGKRKAFYAQEMTKASPALTPADKQYFIAQTRVVKKKSLRSGRQIGGEQEYLLKSKNGNESTWIKEREYRSLKRDGYL